MKRIIPQFSEEKMDEVRRLTEELKKIISTCKNGYNERFCFYYCRFNGDCVPVGKKIQEMA